MLKHRFIILFLLLLIITACSKKEPIDELIEQLNATGGDYTIILYDMKKEGSIFPSYYHKYRIIQDSKERVTDWLEVSEDFYKKNQNFLGMALITKTKEGIIKYPSPPGYNYIGDERYGHWRKDSSGNSFWEFYGKYALFRDVLSSVGGIFGRGRFSRNDYEEYRTYRQRGQPYYGPHGEFGTSGTYTKKYNPSFFERQKMRMRERRSSFAAKARSRMGRSRVGGFSRSSGFGK